MYKVPHTPHKKEFPAWISHVFNGLMFGVIFYLKLESLLPYIPTPIIYLVYFITLMLSDMLSTRDTKWNYCWIGIQSTIIMLAVLFIIFSQDHVNVLTIVITTLMPAVLIPYGLNRKTRSRRKT